MGGNAHQVRLLIKRRRFHDIFNFNGFVE